MPNRDDGRRGQFLFDQTVECRLRWLIKGRRGFVEEEIVRPMQKYAGHSKTLLLAKRQYPVPVRLFVETRRQGRQSDSRYGFGDRCTLNAPLSAG